MTEALPPVLYKYLRPQHARAMLRDGTVRIGTLFEFRGMETDEERGDAEEGWLRLHSDAGRRVYNSTAELPPILRNMSISCGPAGLATSGERAMQFDSDGPDMLIYCLSERFDRSDMARWGGACVRIAEPSAFLYALDSALRTKIGRLESMHVGRCAYIDRTHNWHRELPAYWLLKPPRYHHQAEIRAAWAVDDASQLMAVIVHSLGIAQACDGMDQVDDAT